MATVVIADDSPTLRRIVTAVLTGQGHEVVAAEDGVGAVQAALRTQPDLVILDVQMPRLSGYAVSRLLKDDWRTSGIPVILLTSLDAPSDRFWGAQTGADSYLTKDFEAGALVATVNEALARASRRLRPDPVDVSDAEVMSAVCDLLDRKLFEASVAASVTELAATAHGLDETAAALLRLLHRVVGYEAAAIVVFGSPMAYVGAPASLVRHVDELLTRAAESATALAADATLARPLERQVVRLSDGEASIDDGAVVTYLAMPLSRVGGRPVGLIALSSTQRNAFADAALATLQIAAGPAALLLDHARLAAR